MIARLRGRLTYANVAATLALVLALGGGSFAVAALSHHDKKVVKRIANKQITKRAPGLSVKHAGSADAATNATHAQSANSATNAGTADTATNADKVDGVDSSSGFGLVYYGTAPQADGVTVIQWPELGARFETTGTVDGKVRIENIHPSQNLHVLYGPSEVVIFPGGHLDVVVTSVTDFIVWNAPGTRSWHVVCGRPTLGVPSGPEVRCQGLASRVG